MTWKTASLVGIPSRLAWSTTALLHAPAGELYVAASWSGSEDAPAQGRKFIRELEALEPTDSAALYHFVTQHTSSQEQPVSGALALVDGTKVLLLTFGHGVVLLLRPAGNRWLMDGQQEQSVLEGEISPGDQVVLGTLHLPNLLPNLESWQPEDPEAITAQLFAPSRQPELSAEVALSVIQRVAESSEVVSDVPEEESPEEMASEPDLPDSLSRSTVTHLIDPNKLQHGVSAQQPTLMKRSMPSALRALRLPSLRQLHALRIIVVLGVVVLVFGVLWGYRRMNVQREYRATIMELETKIAELQALPESDRFQKRLAAESLKERLAATTVTYRQNRQILGQLQQQAETIFQTVSGEKNVVNLPVFFDFRLISADYLGTWAGREKEQAYFWDAGKRRLISLNLGNKQNELTPVESVDQAFAVVPATGKLVFLAPGKLWSSRLSGAEVTELDTLKEGARATHLATYGENAYVVDAGTQNVWRVPLSEDEDASPSAWLRSARGVDLTEISSLAIDGELWMGDSTGKVIRLSRGERVAFEAQGIAEPFTSSLLVSVVDSGKKVVVVEPQQKRLVVLNKENGQYEQQVTSEQLGAVTHVLLSDDEKTVTLLAGSVVYRVEL